MHTPTNPWIRIKGQKPVKEKKRIGRPPVPIEIRFWAKVNKVDDANSCWEYQGAPQPDGYCRIQSPFNEYQAHRVSWILNNGPIPDGLLVCHSCDNRKCVRPSHLFLGTHQDNTQDMIKKGRKADVSGARNGMFGKVPHNKGKFMKPFSEYKPFKRRNHGSI